MNLYERLKPEIKKGIEQREKEFHFTMEELIDELKSKESVFMMTYGTFLELEIIVRFHTDLNPHNPIEYFVK